MIDSQNIHILRPSGFEFTGKLKEAVLAAVPQNITSIQKELTFVDFSGIQDYVTEHPRAAHYLASIRTQKETKNIDKDLLKTVCNDNGIGIQEQNGKITIQQGHIIGFLEILDRRRYECELIKGSHERYVAPSRRKVGN
jgi:hypothetical protein